MISMPVENAPGASSTGSVAVSIQESTNRKNLLLLVYLRWIAVSGQVVSIFVVDRWLRIPLPLTAMGCVVLFLIGLNLASLSLRRHRTVISNTELFVALLFDVFALTALLYLSGGAINPFISLFLLQVILGAVLLSPVWSWTLVTVASICFIALIRFHIPIDLTAYGVGPELGQSAFLTLRLYGMFLCFLMVAVLQVLFVTQITGNLRSRDRLLSDLQRRSAEEEHIVRMGLLASGAAHELGSPLAILSVIINDWGRMPGLADNPEIGGELAEMRVALDSCKAIVSQILMAAGEARGEGSERTTLSEFLADVVDRWRATRFPKRFAYRADIGADTPIAADRVIRQMLLNILDNALEASPEWVGVEVRRRGPRLVVTVRDRGKGFAPETLANIGKPYQSTKGRAGSGLGLFLVVNVLHKLGGTLSVENRAEGGAQVDIVLPIASLALESAPQNAG